MLSKTLKILFVIELFAVWPIASQAATPCKTTLECAQAAVTAAAEAQAAVKALQDRLQTPPILICEGMDLNSPWERNPTVEVMISPALKAAGYTLVSGGCDLSGLEPGAPGGRPHNGPITASKPDLANQGWFCRAMDPPNIPEIYSVQATALFCKIKGQ